MLPNLFSSLAESAATISFAPDSEFLNESLLELVAAISPEAEAFVLDGLDTLATATGDLSIAAGQFEGSLTTAAGETLPISLDAPTMLSQAGDLLGDANGSLSLVDGILNASLDLGEDLLEVVDFNLAAFAAEGLSFLVSEADAVFPIENGTLAISEETPLGLFEGAIAFGNGVLDIDLLTPAGDLDFAIPFSPEALFPFVVPTPLGDVDAVVDFFAGNISAPLPFGMDIEVPLDSLTGDLTLSDGIASLSFDTPLGPITTDFDVDDLVGDVVVDYLTGVSIDAQLLTGQLEVLATSGTESAETSVDLIGLANQAVDILTQTNGELSLDAGLLSGLISIGEETIDVNQSVDDLLDLLASPIGDLFALSPAVV